MCKLHVDCTTRFVVDLVDALVVAVFGLCVNYMLIVLLDLLLIW